MARRANGKRRRPHRAGRRHPVATRTERARRLPAGRTLRDAAGAGARRVDQSRADPVRAAATTARRSVVVPARVVHERARPRSVGCRASGRGAVARSRSQAQCARTTGEGGVRTRLRAVPRRAGAIDSTGDAQRSSCAGDSVSQHLQPVSTPRRSNRALRVRSVFATTCAQRAHLRDRVVGRDTGPWGDNPSARGHRSPVRRPIPAARS